jgi:hypothetical protein
LGVVADAFAGAARDARAAWHAEQTALGVLSPRPGSVAVPRALGDRTRAHRRVERRNDSTVVRLIDIARRRFDVTRGSAPVRALVPVVAKLRAAFARGDRNALARTLEVEGSPGERGRSWSTLHSACEGL